jgi:NAD(P)-dependent dehydrogenase (short-subunit alcohol dehydrogenase family)
MRFDSKSGIVTGGGSGMGREVVNLVTQQGGEVLIVDQNEEGSAAVAAEVGGHSGSASYVVADVTKEGEVAAAVERCVSEFGASTSSTTAPVSSSSGRCTKQARRSGTGSTTSTSRASSSAASMR